MIGLYHLVVPAVNSIKRITQSIENRFIFTVFQHMNREILQMRLTFVCKQYLH